MGMNIILGIVIGINSPINPSKAKVRIPSIHGMPLTDTNYKKIKSTNVLDTIARAKKRNLDWVTESNDTLTVDKDIPWYPICYPFKSNIGPDISDVVWIAVDTDNIGDGIVLGWTSNKFQAES